MYRSLLTFALFQVAWFACVLGASRGAAGTAVGVGVALLVAAVHLTLERDRGRELALFAVVCCGGMLVDSVLMLAGITRYAAPAFAWPAFLAPPWIAALWVMFAMLLRRTLAWLRPYPLLAALLGGVGGPLSFLAGVRLGALELHPDRLLAWLVLAPVWGILTAVLVRLPAAAPFAAPPFPSGAAGEDCGTVTGCPGAHG